MRNKYQKKGIGPVVVTVLLLSVAVVSFIGLQSWFSDFSSNNLVFKSNLNRDSLTIERLKSNILSVNNRIIDNLSISELKIGNISCNITGQENLRLGINFINISLCTINLNSKFESIKILTKPKIIERTLYLNDLGCSLDGKIINSGDFYIFYNSQTVPYGSSCSYISRTCNDGVLSGSSSYQYSSCIVEGQDIIPDFFSFINQTDVEVNTLVTSNTVIPTGYNGNIAVSVTGSGNPKISIGGGSFVTSGTISLGQSLTLQLTSSSNELTTSIVNLAFGSGYSTSWKVTTKDYADCLAVDGIQLNHSQSAIFYNSQTVPYGSSCSYIERTCNDGVLSGSSSYQYSSCIVEGQDIIPNAFSFINQTDVEVNTLVTSNTVFPTGYNGNIAVSVTGSGNPKISIGGGSFVTSGTISLGQSLRIQLTSSSNELTTNIANLAFGSGYSTLWKVTTRDYADCLAVDGIQLNHSQSAIFYNTRVGSTCYSQIRTCNDGVLSGDSNYQYSTCLVSSSLSCVTDTDGDGQISSSCAIYPMTDTTYEGDLDVNDANSAIQVDMSCIFNNNKSGCLSNYVIDGCGSETVLDIGTGLCWDRNFNRGGTKTWSLAKSYCNDLSTHPSGHTDWYLPSRQEFETIIDLTRAAPHITGGNTIFNAVQSKYYWTKTTYGSYTNIAFAVYLGSGLSGVNFMGTGYYYVACVRRN